MNSIKTRVAERWRRVSCAARFVAAAALVCAGAQAQAQVQSQSFYLDDRDPNVNGLTVDARRGHGVFGVSLRVTSGGSTILNNVTYSLTGSDLFEMGVNPDTGENQVQAARNFDIDDEGHYSVTLTAEHGGETDDFRMTIGVYVANQYYACDRTPIIERLILEVTRIRRSSADCASFLIADLGDITEISLLGNGVARTEWRRVRSGEDDVVHVAKITGAVAPRSRTLFDYDFWGMPDPILPSLSGLQKLYLTGANLNRLPPDIFADLPNLRALTFYGSSDDEFRNQDLTEFPARLLADLERLHAPSATPPNPLRFSTNPGDSISGIQYRLAGINSPITELTLDEGNSVNLEIYIAGGIRNPLTLDFENGGSSPVTATPAVIEIPRFSDRATVVLESREGLDFSQQQATTVSWVWRQFTRTAFFRNAADEEVAVASDNAEAILGPDLRVEVRPMLRLTDANPSSNVISSRAPRGAPVGGVAPEVRLGSVVPDGVVYSLVAPNGLFEVNSASGVISLTRALMNSDTGAHPVTLTATHRDMAASLPLTIDIRDGLFICDRTFSIRNRILALINSSGTSHECSFVPPAALAAVTVLNDLGAGGLSELLPHDFNGMTGLENLNLDFLRAQTLPEDIFRDTASLRVLSLFAAGLTSLPPDIFMNLDNLESLNFLAGNLSELPARLLADLEKETRVTLGVGSAVRIGGVQYRLDGEVVAGALALDEGVRHRLQVGVAGGVRSTLTLVLRPDGELPFTVTPTTIEFGPMSNEAVVELMAQPDLDFADRSSSMSWAWQMFTPETDGETEIRTQRLQVTVHNTETFFLEDADPSPNTIVMSAAVGTRVAGVVPVARVGRAGATVAAVGAEYALAGGDLFKIDSVSGVISSARQFTDGNRGRHPVTLTATYRNTTASLPLVISVLHSDGGFDICGRTPVVRDEILRRVNEGGGTRTCADVPAANLASVQTLDFSANPATVETLRAGDFDGLSGLTGLNLRALGLRRLPPDILRGLAGLRMLNLQDNRLTSLPARLLAGLEKPDSVTAGFDAGVLIGDVQYRFGGEAGTELTLDEGPRRSLRIEIPGGVRSTWTLVARTDGAPRPVVTPETVQFSAFSGADAVIVELMIPADNNFDSSTGSVSWAWTMFNAAGAATEIRTQTLRLDVRELDRFEDIDPEVNYISEAAAAGDPVLGWSPQVLVRGAVPEGVRYRLSSDTGGLFGIDSATGALSLVADRTLDFTLSASHQVTVAADVPGFSAVSLDAAIEVRADFVIRDTDTSANTIAAAAPEGTPVAGVALRARFGARVLTGGVVYSLAAPDGLFMVNTATGLISSARLFTDGDIRAHPVTLTAIWQGGLASLPLTIEVRPGFFICDRTPGVREEILDIINNRPGGETYTCHVVRPADLASISTLNLSQRLDRTSALLAHDFDGMAGLENLNLRGVPLASLPDGIFSDTTNLRTLNLGNIRSLRLLPSNTFSNLGQLENLDLSVLGATSLPENIFSGLSNLSVLNLRRSGLTSLPANLFSNLSQLQNLNLGSTQFTNLPDGIFSDLTNLRVLNLLDSNLASVPPDILMNLNRLESLGLSAVALAELPARLLADLERIRPRVLRINADARIGGIQYRAGGAPVTELTLEEGGGSRNLQVEAVGIGGDVRSTLTLVFRPGPESGLTATPTTVRLTPARRMATVALEVPQDLNIASRRGPSSWAWRFNPADAAEVAIRTADLQVSVRDTHRFEDTEPAANRISETAMPGDRVSGWSPQVVVGGAIESAVSYRLSSDAGGLFAIDAVNGALSLAPGQALDGAASPAHQVTVIARVTASGVTASLAVTIEVDPVLVLTDTNRLANIIPVPVPAGVPVQGVALEARHGNDMLTDGVIYTLTGPDLFTVDSASGAISAARQLTEDNIGDYPVTLTATHPRGLPGSLPLTIEVFSGVSVCERTPVIEDDIMRLVNSGREETYSCNFVPSHRLASITTLNFSGRLDRVEALRADDFAGMTGLENLDLGSLGITAVNQVGLPEGLFSDLSSLRVLNLQNSRLGPLPPRLLADLERPPRITAGFDAAARIGGIAYLLDGAPITTPLTLDEGGDSLSLQIRVAGGVHSTWTLVFRADGVSLAATPTAIEFGPLSNTNTAVVELRALRDLNPADSAGEAFYAWEMFDPAAGGAAEIRAAQSLRVNVRNAETFSFEDADPSPNTIAVSAARGTNVAGVAPTVRVGGVAVTTGVAYTLTGSALFAVHSTSGAIFSTRLLTDGNRGNYPVTLTASYRGGAVSLPLTITVGAAGNFYICDRTPLVQEEILYRVNTLTEVRNLGIMYRCADIPAARMASVRTLDFSEYSTTVETLLVHDFEGLSGLASLNLRSLGLRRLPPAVFRGLVNLDNLILDDNNLTPLPPTLFSGLFRLRNLFMASLGLQSLPPGIFRDLSNLNELALRGNNLAPLPRDVFSDLPNLLSLYLGGNNLTSLPPDIFRNQPGLAALTLVDNNLTSLPPGIFSGLTNLYVLELSGNGNLVLPAQVAADLERQPLIALEVDRSARIGGIQYRLDGAAITLLALGEGESRNLQVRVDGGVGSTLTLVARTDGAPPPAVTPATVRFSPFSGATDTAIVELTAPADNDFDNSTGSVSWAWARSPEDDPVEIRAPDLRIHVIEQDRLVIRDADPSTNTIAASAATGTRVGGITPVARFGDAVVTDGLMYSLTGPDLFEANTASGVISAARQFTAGDAGAYPVTLTASHSSGTASLPLDIVVRPGVSICDRTAEVRDEILRVINSRSAGAAYGCGVVPPADLASISTLNVPRQRRDVITLPAHDFDGMPALASLSLNFLGIRNLPENIFRNLPNLRELNLDGNNLTSLPENIFSNLGLLEDLNLAGLATTGLPEVVFSGLTNLRRLDLFESRLTSLPPGIFRNLGMLEYLELSLSNDLVELPAPLLADLERPVSVTDTIVGLDRHVRISGIQYRLDGATTTAVTLNEGESRNLQIEAVGDIRSTLTLVFRAGAESRFTATPSTVHFTSSRRSAPVTLSAPPDLNTGDRSGPVSWVWTSFLGTGLTEVPAPDLRVSVRDTHRFDDTDPAPNRIGETAPENVAVSGWSPQVVVGGVVQTNVRYSLSSDAGGLFEIDTASGALSLAPGRRLNHAASPYEITVAAQVPSGVTGALTATIEVFTLALEDADPAANLIAATAPPGTPVSGVRPVLLVDGAAVADGVFYTLTGSGLFTVATASGMISSAGALGAAGSHPVTLTATYRGAPADLPLTIIVRAEGSLNICARTPLVQMEILRLINTQAEVQSLGIRYGCGSVPTTRVASVRVLDFSQYSTTVETLQADDFDGLSGLTGLVLDSLNLRRLPPGIFSGLPNLTRLSLGDNSLTSLPPDVFSELSRLRVLNLGGNGDLVLPAQAVADLEGLRLTTLEIDRSALINGFRYRAPPGSMFSGNGLVLEEGESRSLRLEAIGGVRSTLTLVLRLDNDDPQFTVTPTTVRFSPFSNTDTAVVELAAPADETIDSVNTGMLWAWTMFSGQPFGTTEIKTKFSLAVAVSDNSGLEDTDPADNRISEAALPGDPVSGWSPQLLIDRAIETNVRYRLSLDAGGLFQVHPVSGTLSLASGRALDYETSAAHTVRVVARARGDEWPLTTTIFVDNSPEALSLSGVVTGSISEAATIGTAVSGLGVSLLESGVPLDGLVADFSLSGAGSQTFAFAVSGNVAGLQLENAALDYETTPEYTLTLRAAYLGESVTTQITVHVLDVVERLVLEAVGPTPFRIGEGAPLNLRVGSVRGKDEAGIPLTGGVFYTATGTELFAVSGNGGIIVEGQLDFEASTSHTLFITASYEELVSNRLRVDIAVLDSPNDLQIVDQSSAENIASNTTGGQVRGLDLVFQIDGVNQAGVASAWFLFDGSGLFDINSATGAITLREPIEFTPEDYDMFVRATWTGGDGVPRTPPPLPLNVQVTDGVPVRIRVFLEGAVIP